MQLITYPSRRLFAHSGEITKFDDDLKQLAEDMIHTMYDQNGKGLSAVQVGSLVRLFVMDYKDNPLVCINPKIIPLPQGLIDGTEGCLSFPGKQATIRRHYAIELTYTDLDKQHHTLDLEGFDARCAQHESDHLEGKLMIHRMGTLTRRLFLENKL